MSPRRGGLLLAVLLLTPRASAAQFAVIDVANLTQNTMTAFQSTISAVEAIFQSAEWVLDLTGYDDTGLGSLGDELGELGALLQETDALLWDIRNLEAQTARLFNLDTAPDSARDLRARLQEIRAYRAERVLQAQRLQTLQRTAMRIADRILGLVDRILGILGDKQGLQNLQAHLATLTHTEVQTGVAMAAYQQVALDDTQAQQLVEASIERINADIFRSTIQGGRTSAR